MIFKSKDIDNIYVPDDEYFKEYAGKLAKESVARVVEKINSEWWPTLLQPPSSIEENILANLIAANNVYLDEEKSWPWNVFLTHLSRTKIHYIWTGTYFTLFLKN